MIKNERQYRITKAQADKFIRALDDLDKQTKNTTQVHPLLQKAQRDALSSQLADLRSEIEEYEVLRSGQRSVLVLDSLEELPQALIKARIASGLSQKALATQLGIKEQQMQRYEATEYAHSSLSRVMDIARTLGIQVREEVLLPSAQASPSILFKRLKQIGLDPEFVAKRLLPPALRARLAQVDDTEMGQGASLALQASTNISRVFGWSPNVFFGPMPLQLDTSAAKAVRYKKTKKADRNRINAYTVYAHFLALLVLEATESLPREPIPTEPSEVRENILSQYGSLTFDHALLYAWSLGIPVLPLSDPGAFHGACWRVDGRNVIVLKQKTQSSARWLFDLLHELRHAGQEPDNDQLSIIEASDTAQERRESLDEQEASRFAGNVILDGRSEELANLCVDAARGSVERLKAALPRVAEKEHVPIDTLANYMAFRLSLQEINWWGAATNLQSTNHEPWQIARDIFLRQVTFDRLNEVDRNLLAQSLSD